MSFKDRGFASMDKDKQRAIASKGGKAAHALGRAHHWTSETATVAGRKGGRRTKARRIEEDSSTPSSEPVLA